MFGIWHIRLTAVQPSMVLVGPGLVTAPCHLTPNSKQLNLTYLSISLFPAPFLSSVLGHGEEFLPQALCLYVSLSLSSSLSLSIPRSHTLSRKQVTLQQTQAGVKNEIQRSEDRQVRGRLANKKHPPP